MRTIRLSILSLILHLTVGATDYLPWYGAPFQLETKADVRLEIYPELQTGSGTKDFSSCDGYLDLGASLAVFDNYSLEIEIVSSDNRNFTRQGIHGTNRYIGVDSILVTGKHLWFSDVVGDPVSLSTGITLSQVFKYARRSLSGFYHGGIQGEAHVAIGKEMDCLQFWTSRWWALGAIGIADIGSPWLRAEAGWQVNWWDRHRAQVFLKTLWGCGENNINPYRTFHGYGPIHHQSIDAGIGYSFGFEYGIWANVEYAYRIYAINCPKKNNHVLLSLLYPF